MPLLGTLLMARSGLSTRTVRMADRLALWPSREYSITLKTQRDNLFITIYRQRHVFIEPQSKSNHAYISSHNYRHFMTLITQH